MTVACLEPELDRPNQRAQSHREVEACLSCGSREHSPIFTRNGYELVRCGACQLAYIRNPPSQDVLEHLYSFADEYHSEFADSATAREQFLKRGRLYLRYLSKHARSGRLLDLGCSAGFFMKVARDSGWTVAGLEFSRDSAAVGRRLYGLDIAPGSLCDCDLPEHSFDAITLWDVIEHLPDPMAAMRRAHALLKPGGLVGISTPDIDGLYPQASLPIGRLINYWTHAEPPAHLTQFSTKTLSSLMHRAGFEVVETISRRIPLSYSFGAWHELMRMPKRLAYAAVFWLPALVGPWIKRGDEAVLIARKR